jgi:hypothetical protein
MTGTHIGTGCVMGCLTVVNSVFGAAASVAAGAYVGYKHQKTGMLDATDAAILALPTVARAAITSVYLDYLARQSTTELVQRNATAETQAAFKQNQTELTPHALKVTAKIAGYSALETAVGYVIGRGLGTVF